MTEIHLEDCTEFSKIKDIWNDGLHDKNALREFLDNVVMNEDNGYGKMLPDFSDIYVLVSTKEFPFESLTFDQKNANSIDLSAATQHFILGYIWLCPWVLQNEGCVPCHFIQFIDSRIPGLNISKYMIQQYESMGEERHLFPYEVMRGAKYYWKKYFMEIFQIQNTTELSQMISEYEFKNIKWDELISAFDR